MWTVFVKEYAMSLQELSGNFVKAVQNNDIPNIIEISSTAQSKLTEMFKQLRLSQDHGELSKDLGENCSLGYYQKSIPNDFNLFKQQNQMFTLNEKLNLRDCANAVFHSKISDYYIENNKHWLLYKTDRNQLIIMDIQKVCNVVIQNVKENPL